MPSPVAVLAVLGLVAGAAVMATKKTPAAPRGPTITLDQNLPPEITQRVVAALMGENNPATLEAFASQLQPSYPWAAYQLRMRAWLLRGQSGPAPSPPVSLPPSAPPSSPLPPPAPGPSVLPPSILPPTPPTPPVVPSFPGLDPGMTADVAQAVQQALLSETDPAKLEGFGQSIASRYPVSAGLLLAKASALRAAALARQVIPPSPTPPAPSPFPSPTPPAPSPFPPAPTPPAAVYPIGESSTHAGRNAMRPTGQTPFLVIRNTDSVWPAKMAEVVQTATGLPADYKTLGPLNPHLTAPPGSNSWKSLIAGDAINVPWSWAAPLKAKGYAILQDAGAVPS